MRPGLFRRPSWTAYMRPLLGNPQFAEEAFDCHSGECRNPEPRRGEMRWCLIPYLIDRIRQEKTESERQNPWIPSNPPALVGSDTGMTMKCIRRVRRFPCRGGSRTPDRRRGLSGYGKIQRKGGFVGFDRFTDPAPMKVFHCGSRPLPLQCQTRPRRVC